MTIDVKYHADIYPLKMTTNGDWCDLRAAEDVEFKAGEYKLLSLGVSMQLPPGYEALVIPRSSTFKHWGLLQTNSCGLIDNSYCGDNDIWQFPALATRDVLVEKNSRICQFRIQKKMDDVNFNTVIALNNTNRKGFGSSGVF
jgi:dUTP pyrophosphatase